MSPKKRGRREIGALRRRPVRLLPRWSRTSDPLPHPRGGARVVDGVSFTVERGRTLGIVGESGSGKTILSCSVINLLPKNAIRDGSVKLMGREISTCPTATCGTSGAPRWPWCSRTP